MTEATVTLSDGRLLGFAIYGPEQGRPVLYFHGTPSSRREPQLLHTYGINPESLLQQTGLRLIAVDRPGMGLSTFNPCGTLLSFAHDAAALLQQLNILHCPVLCWSGGGPYALAMAWQFPELISAAFILCGFSRQFTPEVIKRMRLNRWYFQAAQHAPWLLKPLLEKAGASHPGHALPRWLTGLPRADYDLLKTPAQLNGMIAHSLREACRSGGEGAVHDARIYFQPFGFVLSEIKQPVHYWWGTEDNNVIKLHPAAVAQHIQQDYLHVKSGEGHLSVYVKYFAEAVLAIASNYAAAPD